METIMRKFALLGASALVLALGVATASAEPSTQQLLNAGQGFGQTSSSATLSEGRAAATEAPAADAFIWQQHQGR
jgi:pectate lyase